MLGVLWNWTLYGVLVVQLCEFLMACLLRLWNSSGGEDVYSYNFPGDRPLLKLLGMYYVLVVPSALSTAPPQCTLYSWWKRCRQHSLERTFTIGSSPALAIRTTSLLTCSPWTCPLSVPWFHSLSSYFSCIASGYSAEGHPGFYVCPSVS
jgi:hypothetical protein